MEFKQFLKHRREELGFSQQELADRLSQEGQETGYGRVSHWETGRNKPPLEDVRFRRTLAGILQIDVNDMMKTLGYEINEEDRIPEARIAADIIELLPEEGRSLALDYLDMLKRRYARTN